MVVSKTKREPLRSTGPERYTGTRNKPHVPLSQAEIPAAPFAVRRLHLRGRFGVVIVPAHNWD
jgi:hypothetical protein